MTTESGFVYSLDIQLASKPLNEAWLELQWRTADLPALPPAPVPVGIVDSNFQWALSSFYNSIKADYPVREQLPASQMPFDLVPHSIMYRFRKSAQGWPLVQFGPGIATINFTQAEYTSWAVFRAAMEYLRESVNAAYAGTPLHLTQIILRYRDIFPFDHRINNISNYMREMLNVEISWPEPIPGNAAQRTAPSDLTLSLGFRMNTPEAKGSLRLGSAMQEVAPSNETPILLAEFEMRGLNVDPELLSHSDHYLAWLDSAHLVIHDWFFALIDGQLLSQYKAGAE